MYRMKIQTQKCTSECVKKENKFAFSCLLSRVQTLNWGNWLS